VELAVPAVSPRDEAFRARPPEPLPQAAFRPPKVEETRLPNGMRLIVAERHAVRLVSAELVMVGGSASLPGEAPAALSLIAGSAVHGTKSFTETQLFGEMNAHLIEIKPDVRDIWFGVSMRAPSPSLERGLQMIHAMMLEPTFPPQAFEIVRNQQIGSADLDAENVDLIARRNLYGALYGPSHPYTRAIAPRKGDLTRTTRDDVIRVWRETVDPSIATLVVVGDVDAGQVRRLVEGQFGAWQHDPNFPPRALVPAAAPGGPRLVVVDRPGAKQAKVLYGAVAPAAGSPDHPAHLLMRALIGGMRSSALATELRDEIGATSREGVDFADRPGVGLDWWYGSVAPERTADVLATLDRRMRELRARGPSSDELSAAKGRLVLSFPRRFETISQFLGTLVRAAEFELPLDYGSQMIAGVSAVSNEEVRAAFPDPVEVKAVVVGDLASLKDSLLALGWGAIAVNDAEGHLVQTLSR
jgi:zinc protease